MSENLDSNEKANQEAGRDPSIERASDKAIQEVSSSSKLDELRAMEVAFTALVKLASSGRINALDWLHKALDVAIPEQERAPLPRNHSSITNQPPQASSPAVVPQTQPREFMSRKKPQSLVERIACLAYYLTKFRQQNYFKTADIVALNTEAAGHRFGNPARDFDNADRQNGYLVTAGNGSKQITVRGEAVVEALPEREAVKAALSEHPYKKKRVSSTTKKTSSQSDDEE